MRNDRAATRTRKRTESTTPSSSTVVGAFTLGYQGRDLKEVLEIVQRVGVEQVLDVRQNASSRKRGFSSDELKGSLNEVGVAYVHLPELGCENESRHALWRGAPPEGFLELYARRLAERPQSLAELVRRARSARTMVLCLERDSARCHRAVLSERLRAEGMIVQDL